jgi:hypothetical protein
MRRVVPGGARFEVAEYFSPLRRSELRDLPEQTEIRGDVHGVLRKLGVTDEPKT